MCPSLTAMPPASVHTPSEPVAPPTEPAAPPTEPVEVRTADVDGLDAPVQLLVRGRLWLVRDARRLPAAAATLERWRVQAGDGASGSVTVFDLLRLGSGRWSLAREDA